MKKSSIFICIFKKYIGKYEILDFYVNIITFKVNIIVSR